MIHNRLPLIKKRKPELLIPSSNDLNAVKLTINLNESVRHRKCNSKSEIKITFGEIFLQVRPCQVAMDKTRLAAIVSSKYALSCIIF